MSALFGKKPTFLSVLEKLLHVICGFMKRRYDAELHLVRINDYCHSCGCF